MNSVKFKALTLIFLGGLIVAIQFQNCAKPNRLEKNGSSPSEVVDSIDPIYNGTLVFDKAYVELAELPMNIIKGTCDVSQEGSQLSWELFESEDRVIEMGQATCSLSRFDVKIDFVAEFPCNREFTLRAYLGAKARDELIVIRKCN